MLRTLLVRLRSLRPLKFFSGTYSSLWGLWGPWGFSLGWTGSLGLLGSLSELCWGLWGLWGISLDQAGVSVFFGTCEISLWAGLRSLGPLGSVSALGCVLCSLSLVGVSEEQRESSETPSHHRGRPQSSQRPQVAPERDLTGLRGPRDPSVSQRKTEEDPETLAQLKRNSSSPRDPSSVQRDPRSHRDPACPRERPQRPQKFHPTPERLQSSSSCPTFCRCRVLSCISP